MEGDGKKRRPKITKDKNGNRIVRQGKKKIMVPNGIGDADFLKWLIKYLKPKRRKTARKSAPAATPAQPAHDYLDFELGSGCR
jgi:hypothetical protein